MFVCVCLCVVLFASDKELSANIYKPRLGSGTATSACADVALRDSVVSNVPPCLTFKD